ncbi:MAG: 4-amino-4-deoxy-L-arabinose transferase-like glycosyltransferase [Saprospiraceae bacterium]|jgi:4-amino-4-deoxy-L-arabinose transferase-like glycosyltransferase
MSNFPIICSKLKNIAKSVPSLVWLAVIWTIGIVLVNPMGDFPLNDDFSYGRTVYNLSELNIFLFDDWLAMSLIAQVLWGAAFTKIFGFSFTVLRFSTLVLAYLGLSACYLLGRDLGGSRKLSLIAALCIGFSPIFFSLSYTFMTDIPFFSFMVLSIYFFNKFLKREHFFTLLLASFFTIAATLTRQLGLMLPISFLLTYLIRSFIYTENRRLKDFVIAIMPLVIGVLAYVLFKKWFVTVQDLPENYDNASRLMKRLNKDFGLGSMQRIGLLICYIGTFLIPIVLAVVQFRFWENREGESLKLSKLQKKIVGGLVLFLIACLGVGISHVFWGNIFNGIALGPTLLKDGQHFVNIPKFTSTQETIVKTLFLGGGILFTLSIVPVLFKSLKKENPQFLSGLFAAMNILVYGGFLMLESLFFDRYFIQLLPFVLMLIFVVNSKLSKKYLTLSLATLLIMSLYSIAGTHDYLAWHRAKKQALEHLTLEMKIPSNQIDGGFEFNGWNRKPGQKRQAGHGKSPWWIDEEYYAVTFGDIKFYKRVKAFPFRRWLPPQQDSLFIMEVKYR